MHISPDRRLQADARRALRLAAGLVMAAGLALPSVAAPGQDLVGSLVPPYPKGLDSLIGSCVGDPEVEDVCAVSIATLNLPDGRPIALYAGRFAERREDGTAVWLITHIHHLPAVPEGYYLEIGACRKGSVDDPAIAAIVGVHDPEAEILDDVAWAARLDRAAGTLAEIDPAGVDCWNLDPGPAMP